MDFATDYTRVFAGFKTQFPSIKRWCQKKPRQRALVLTVIAKFDLSTQSTCHACRARLLSEYNALAPALNLPPIGQSAFDKLKAGLVSEGLLKCVAISRHPSFTRSHYKLNLPKVFEAFKAVGNYCKSLIKRDIELKNIMKTTSEGATHEIAPEAPPHKAPEHLPIFENDKQKVSVSKDIKDLNYKESATNSSSDNDLNSVKGKPHPLWYARMFKNDGPLVEHLHEKARQGLITPPEAAALLDIHDQYGVILGNKKFIKWVAHYKAAQGCPQKPHTGPKQFFARIKPWNR